MSRLLMLFFKPKASGGSAPVISGLNFTSAGNSGLAAGVL